MVESTEVFYVGGYHLTVCVPAALALGEHAAKTNKVYMLSLSAGFIPQFFKDQLAEVLTYTDYVFGNENEAKTWAETQGHKDISIPEAARLLALAPKANSKRPRVVIITQGTDPTIVAVAEQGKDVQVQEYPVAAIESSAINDTNGAGDAFAGGFCAGVVEGDSLASCIKKGHWLARLGLQELGPSYVHISSFHVSFLCHSPIPSSYQSSSLQRSTDTPLAGTHGPNRHTSHSCLAVIHFIVSFGSCAAVQTWDLQHCP